MFQGPVSLALIGILFDPFLSSQDPKPNSLLKTNCEEDSSQLQNKAQSFLIQYDRGGKHPFPSEETPTAAPALIPACMEWSDFF